MRLQSTHYGLLFLKRLEILIFWQNWLEKGLHFTQSQIFRFWLLIYDECDFKIIYIEDPVEDYIWIFFICELKVRIDIQEGQILVCFSVKIWSEKSQNFNNFGQKSIVGALY